jgi:murein DD-endopeptidase MepM/ murein hydrolase activator NlpD
LADVAEVSNVAGVKKAGRLAALLLALVIVVPLVDHGEAGAATPTQRQTEINRRLNRLRDQVEEASAEEAAVLDQLDAIEDKRKELDAKVATLDAQVNAAQNELDAATAQFNELAAQLAQTQGEVDAARRLLAEARARLTARAVNAYMGTPDIRTASHSLQEGGQRDLAIVQGYVETLVQAQNDLIDQYKERKAELETHQAEAQTRKDASQGQRDVVAHRTAAVAAARRVQAAAREEVLGQERQKEALLAKARSQRRSFETQIAQLKAESSAITSFLRGVQRGQGPAISGRGIFASPIPGAAITSRFGPRVHPIYGDVRIHTGIDFRAATGTPVRAAGAGNVVYAGWRGGYGNTVIIDHGNSLATLYGHLSSISVNVGQRVARGQTIARAGSTGLSTGPHLHFEVRASGVPVDPLGYL